MIRKPIEGFEGYEVTSDGDIISYKTGGTGRSDKGRVMNWFYGSSGYRQVKLSKKGKGYHFPIHRLVATHLVEGRFDGAVVNHINGDKDDNRASNLEWVTQRENIAHVDKVQNYVPCKVYHKGQLWGEFKTLTDMRKAVEAEFNISGLSFEKYGYNRRANLTLERCRDYPRGE